MNPSCTLSSAWRSCCFLASSTLLSQRSFYKVAEEEQSVALEADALHHKTDVYSSLGVSVGLLVIVLLARVFKTPWAHYLDPVYQELGIHKRRRFQAATTIPLTVGQAVDQAVELTSRPLTPETSSPSRAPVFLGQLEIFDTEIRSRCLDLFGTFKESGSTERLDTVLSEATRILEDRLAELSGAPPGTTGVELASFAFAGKPPKIVLSEIDAEQQAGHLLFRGVFGFVRNNYHHKLVRDLNPARVLQIVGMIDYLMSLLGGRPIKIAVVD